MIIFCSNQQLARTMLFFENKGLSVKCLVWNKSNPSPLCNGKHIEDIEYVVYVRGKNATWNNEVPLSMKYKVKKFPFVNPKERLHPTQKPIKLLEEYILLHSKENDTILDCFSGSGSTLEACKNLGRKSIGIEIEEKYCEITRVRLGSRNELFD